MRASIAQTDDRPGFRWQLDGRSVSLAEVMAADDEPERLPPTHLEALDDALIAAAGTFGEILGGGRDATAAERDGLRALHRALDRLNHEYAAAVTSTRAPVERRAGQIVGTSALMAILARGSVGLLGPAPLEAELDEPGAGVVGGYGDLVVVAADRPWAGARWVVRTPDGRRLPASLSMLLFDSSGVNKDAAVDEHRAALEATIAGAELPGADPLAAACAIDWMLYDWLMAHRDGPDSGAITVKTDRDAAMIVAAADLSVRCRATLDPTLLRP